MMNRYIIIELGKIKPFCFISSLAFELPLHDRYILSEVKIDTGCMRTCISYKRVLRRNEDIFECKHKAINNDLKATLSYGVNDSEDYLELQKKLFKEKRYQECTAISFWHDISEITLEGYKLPVKQIRVNYDRPSSMLIGMDILSQLDFHCGYSKVLNNYVFIGVLRSQEDKSDYYRALEEHFGILSNLYQDFIHSEREKNEASGFLDWVKRRF